jgi:hypothetical protein
MPRTCTSLALLVTTACATAAAQSATAERSTPPPSAGHSLVYADDLGMVLLINAGLGGMTDPAVSTPTRLWGWNGTGWLLLDSAGPPVRNLAGVAWDSRRHTLVMHGGTYDRDRSYDETWEWSRPTGWKRFTGPGPGLRDHTQMAYDPGRGKAMLFGGSGSDPNVALADTWEFDGTRWERVATAGPPALVHHAMQYDPALRRVVVFGGFTPGGRHVGDTWAWDGTRWTALPPAAEPRSHARMAYHRRLNLLLVAGAMRSTSLVAARGDAGWAPLAVTGGPSLRYLPEVAYDARRNVLVLFGGGDLASGELLNDTWEFDGTAWQRKP